MQEACHPHPGAGVVSEAKCGTCPACRKQGGRTECDRVLEARLLESMAPIFGLLTDPTIPAHRSFRELMTREEK